MASTHNNYVTIRQPRPSLTKAQLQHSGTQATGCNIVAGGVTSATKVIVASYDNTLMLGAHTA